MQLKVFRPEIERNRLVTNWVIVHAGAHAQGRKSTHWFTRLGSQNRRFIWFGLALLVVAISVWSNSVGSGTRTIVSDGKPDPGIIVHTAKSISPSDSSFATDICTDSNLFNQLNGLPFDMAEVPNVVGFVSTSSTKLGGALIVTYRCRSESPKVEFIAEWFLAGKSWRLKQISRLPARQPGDL
jgi:hypothetical protein